MMNDSGLGHHESAEEFATDGGGFRDADFDAVRGAGIGHGDRGDANREDPGTSRNHDG